MTKPIPRWLVMKYGGTSVSTAASWSEIDRQVRRATDAGQHVMVVVSALAGVTNRLQQIANQDGDWVADLAWIRDQHNTLATAVGIDLPAEVSDRLNELEQLAQAGRSPAEQASILAQGELLSSQLGAAVLARLGRPVRWQDARSLLQAGSAEHQSARAAYLAASADCDADPGLAASLAEQGAVHITQGFLASNQAGQTVVLGRGGSDTSAAYLAAKLTAEAVEIWTDVPGMFSTNPREIPSARLLKVLAYREAQELASMGAKVLHPRCIAPTRQREIPILIRQTSRPEIEGTEISPHAREVGAQVKAIVQRQGITLISMEGLGMWHQVGFLADAFALFKKHRLSVDLISTSEANVTVSLDLSEHLLDGPALQALTDELALICRVKVIHHCASVSLVGSGIRTILHKLGPALEVFEQRRIYLVSQAANDLNLTFVVDEKDANKLVKQLHQQLIPGGVGGDSVFGPTWEQLFKQDEPVRGEVPWWVAQRPALLEQLGHRDCAYVYSVDAIRDAANRLAQVKACDFMLYAMKANSHPEVLRTLNQAGIGMECVSMQEVDHALEVLPELSPSQILFTPNFAPRREYRAALDRGVNLTVDNLFVLENWASDLRGHEVFLRIDPGSGLGHHKMVRTAGQFSKFGIPLNEVGLAASLARQHEIRVVGLHAHTGSGIMVPDNWERTLTALGELVSHFDDLRIIDIGGGLGVPDKQDQLPLDTVALNERLEQVKSALPEGLELWIEPGRYLIAQAGVLLARVTQTKGKGDVRYMGVATGMNSLIRPALYGAYHEIVNLTRLDQAHDQVWNVVGPICETGDVLGLDRVLPESSEGDVLLIANAGAYSAAMASHYNRRPPAEELIL